MQKERKKRRRKKKEEEKQKQEIHWPNGEVLYSDSLLMQRILVGSTQTQCAFKSRQVMHGILLIREYRVLKNTAPKWNN